MEISPALDGLDYPFPAEARKPDEINQWIFRYWKKGSTGLLSLRERKQVK